MDKILKAKLNMMKATRAKIRLKHALRADDEIRDVLPAAIKAFDKAVMQHKLQSHEPIDLTRVLTEVGASLDRKIDNGK